MAHALDVLRACEAGSIFGLIGCYQIETISDNYEKYVFIDLFEGDGNDLRTQFGHKFKKELLDFLDSIFIERDYGCNGKEVQICKTELTYSETKEKLKEFKI